MVEKLKKIVLVFMLQILSISLYAQKSVTQFLGIPVDGSKPEMIQKLKSKGFTSSPVDKDILVGEFNGKNVFVNIVTNNNKVCRIVLNDVNTSNESDIKIRFNYLVLQFKKNKKYFTLAQSDQDYIIPDDEDISYEMSVKKKRYEADFYQMPTELDTVSIREKVKSILASKYTEEQLSNPTEELKKEMITTGATYLLDIFSKNSVWFMISELYGKYYISMFYDNEYNRANGDDL